MYRHLFRNIGVIVLLHKKLKTENICCTFQKLLLNSQKTVDYCRTSFKFSTNNGTELENHNPFETDEYITPYVEQQNEYSRRNAMKDDIISMLRYTYRTPEAKISKLLESFKPQNWEDLKKVLDILHKKGVYRDSILTNPWILKNSSRLLEIKLGVLNTISMHDINDFVPYLRHSVPRLQKLITHLNEESNIIPGTKNRLYYISKKLSLDPIEVSNCVSKRLFILEMPFDMLQENLNYMIEYGVAPKSILKDLWAFRYAPKSVKARLERAKDANKDKIMPWMVRCPERIFQKSIKLSLDELEILGKNNTVVDYIAERLDFDPETIRLIMQKDDQLHSVRVTKIKEILDYLIDEEKFPKHSIIQVPRILCHGLETTKARIEELKSINCRPSSLIILCRSRREYEKFVRQWSVNQEKIKQRQKLT